jgi:hypothetical protein
MTWVVLLLLVVAVLLVARPDRRLARAPRPGEDQPRQDLLVNVPDGMVVLRPSLPTNEARVAHGLLTSAGIVAALKPSSSSLHPYTRTEGPLTDLLVAADAVEEADALLTELPE